MLNNISNLILLKKFVIFCWCCICFAAVSCGTVLIWFVFFALISQTKKFTIKSVYVGWTGSPTRQLRRWCSDKVYFTISILLRSREKKSALCYTFEAFFYLCHLRGACVYCLCKIWRKEEKVYNTSRVVTFFLLKKLQNKIVWFTKIIFFLWKYCVKCNFTW